MDEFYKTRMGKTYYEHTMPELVRQLTQLNEQLERLIDRLDDQEPECPTSHPQP